MRYLILLMVGALILGCSSNAPKVNKEVAATRKAAVASLYSRVKDMPEDPEARLALGDWLVHAEDYAAAIAQYDTALLLQPNSLPTKVSRAGAYYQSGQVEAGLTGFLEVLRVSEAEPYTASIANSIHAPFSLRQLTSGASDNYHARYAPSGQEITFQSNRDGNWELYRMQLDDLRPLRLTFEAGDDESPVYSPDGREIFFTSTRASQTDQRGKLPRDIFSMNATDGTGLRRLVSDAADDWYPAVSPKGKWFVFASDRADTREGEFGDRQSDLYIYSMEDGQIASFSTEFGDKSAPAVAPDGDKVIYVNNVNGDFEIYEQDRREQYGRRLIWGGGPKGGPRYAPDGKKIVYYEKNQENFDLFLYDLKHKQLARLTSDPAMDLFPAFSPLGDKLVFSSNRDGSFHLYEMNLSKPPSRLELAERITQALARVTAAHERQ